jgi:hypothetical protein
MAHTLNITNGQLWKYQYVDNGEIHEPLFIFITKILKPNIRRNYEIIQFYYLDTLEEDEMSDEIFNRYCQFISG